MSSLPLFSSSDICLLVSTFWNGNGMFLKLQVMELVSPSPAGGEGGAAVTGGPISR